MATRPDINAHFSHEDRVRAFMASVPKRRRERIEAKYAVLSEELEAEIFEQERPAAPELLDQVLATGCPVHRSPLRSLPDLDEEA